MVSDDAGWALIGLFALLPVIIAVLATLFFVILGLAINKKHKKKSKRISYLSVACFALATISLGFLPAKYLLSKADYQSDTRKDAHLLNFTVYETTKVPNKLTARYISDPKGLGNSFIRSYYEGIRIDQFNLSRTAEIFHIAGQSWDNPLDRNKCGPTDPEFGYMLKTCKLLTQTRSGIEIYYNEFPPREDPLPATDFVFANINNTGITVSGSFSSWEEVVRIYDSLKSVDPTKIDYPSDKGFLN